MTLEQYAYLAEIIGVTIVVITLIYLAVQVRQGAHLMRSESRQALISNDHASVQIAIENVDLFEKLTKPEGLSFEDQWRFSNIWILDMRNREHEYFQYKAGVLDEETWQSYRQILRFSGF